MRAFLVVVLTATLLFSCSTERGEKPDYGIITFELDDSTQVVLETGALELGGPITIKNSAENIVLRPVSETVFSVPVFMEVLPVGGIKITHLLLVFGQTRSELATIPFL